MKIREPFNGLSHLAGAALALIGLVGLLAWGGDRPGKVVALLVYGLSLVGLFLASGLYHSVAAGPKVTALLRKIDHSAIYLLIAGTYTPFCALALTGFWQWGLLAIVWMLALTGIVAKVFVINTPRWLTAGLYLLMGWIGVGAIGEFTQRLPVSALVWLAVGGVLYTLGALVYITRKLDFFPGVFGFHEVWHIFVLLGAGAHFISVASIV